MISDGDSSVDDPRWDLDDRIIHRTLYVNVIDDENFGYNIILPETEIFTSFQDQESVVLKVPEEETGTFSFSLTGPPTHDVTVTVAEVSDKFDLSSNTAVFTPDNWGSFQTFTIMPTDDADAVDELGVITLTGASTDSGYDDYTDSFIVIIDDDELIIDISSYSVNVDEGGTATVDVRLLQDSLNTGSIPA